MSLAVEKLLDKLGPKALSMLDDLMVGAGVGKGGEAKNVEGLSIIKSAVKFLSAFVGRYVGALLKEGWVGWDEGEEEEDDVELAEVMVDHVKLRVFVGVLERGALDAGERNEVPVGVLVRIVDKAERAEVEASFGR